MKKRLKLCANHSQLQTLVTSRGCDYCKALEVIKSLTMRLEWLDSPQYGSTEQPWIKQGQKILKANGIEL